MLTTEQIQECIQHEVVTSHDHLVRYKYFFDLVKKDLGIYDHPKADLLMQIAWDDGHGSGYFEVYYFARELAELIG